MKKSFKSVMLWVPAVVFFFAGKSVFAQDPQSETPKPPAKESSRRDGSQTPEA